MVLLYAAAGRDAAATNRPLAATGWFLAGYLSAWIAFSLVATGAQWTLTRLALLTPMMESESGIFGGIVLIAAGLYQWSPLKNTCLRQCQTPLGFLLSRGGFRSGPFAALRIGAERSSSDYGESRQATGTRRDESRPGCLDPAYNPRNPVLSHTEGTSWLSDRRRSLTSGNRKSSSRGRHR